MTAEPEDGVEEIKVVRQPHLKPQNAQTVDPTKLTALTPEVVRITKREEKSKKHVCGDFYVRNTFPCCNMYGGFQNTVWCSLFCLSSHL